MFITSDRLSGSIGLIATFIFLPGSTDYYLIAFRYLILKIHCRDIRSKYNFQILQQLLEDRLVAKSDRLGLPLKHLIKTCGWMSLLATVFFT